MSGLKFAGVFVLGNFYHCAWCLAYVREGDAGSIDKRKANCAYYRKKKLNNFNSE
jgi:hypothetical protein